MSLTRTRSTVELPSNLLPLRFRGGRREPLPDRLGPGATLRTLFRRQSLPGKLIFVLLLEHRRKFRSVVGHIIGREVSHDDVLPDDVDHFPGSCHLRYVGIGEVDDPPLLDDVHRHDSTYLLWLRFRGRSRRLDLDLPASAGPVLGHGTREFRLNGGAHLSLELFFRHGNPTVGRFLGERPRAGHPNKPIDRDRLPRNPETRTGRVTLVDDLSLREVNRKAGAPVPVARLFRHPDRGSVAVVGVPRVFKHFDSRLWDRAWAS